MTLSFPPELLSKNLTINFFSMTIYRYYKCLNSDKIVIHVLNAAAIVVSVIYISCIMSCHIFIVISILSIKCVMNKI